MELMDAIYGRRAVRSYKRELGIPIDDEPVLPIIVGYPKGEAARTPRNKPTILFWK